MTTCAFTGHRPQSFPWKYDETAEDCLFLKNVLEDEIQKLIENGVTNFFTGLAQGVDTWAAQIILKLRETNPVLKLHCVLPCQDQAQKWEPSAQECHQSIQEQANSVISLSENYYDGCMLDRNRYLVEHSDILLAIYNGNWRGGTAMTVRYAKKLGRETIIINPKTKEVEHFNK